ncbi:E3 ubiquitin-protein ligase TRIM11-like [Heteronotia binoei]|uniref:E3 ubiquitin-protein ligase TRIM11-like n=1 Tax=Heteronotia binoei TaxID=13085 RepID=UPI00292D95B9|nr:E3 ubiquitin-protein ligase TRIM11-like [Heteronotia binoei]
MAKPDLAALGEPLRKRIRAQASCGICRGFYTEPVRLCCCGASFCRACVEALLPAACPDCGAALDPARLTPNQSLARLVEIAGKLLEQEERRQAGGAAGGEAPLAEETLFCKQDRALLCPSSYVPEEHRGHDVVPAGQASQEYKAHIQKCLIHLKKEEKDILLNKTTFEIDCEHYARRATLMLGKTKTEFQKMEEFLERQKREVLARVTEVYKEIKMDKKEQIFALSDNLTFLKDIRFEMEEVIQMPRNEFLEQIECTLWMYGERETADPKGSLYVNVENKLCSLIGIQTFVIHELTNFRERMARGLDQLRGEIPALSPSERDPAVVEPEESQLRSILDEALPSNPESSSPQSE